MGVTGNDCGLPIRLVIPCREESHSVHVGVEDHFLGAGSFGDDCDRTLKLLLCDSFVVVTAVKRQVISEERRFHRVRHNEEQVVDAQEKQRQGQTCALWKLLVEKSHPFHRLTEP